MFRGHYFADGQKGPMTFDDIAQEHLTHRFTLNNVQTKGNVWYTKTTYCVIGSEQKTIYDKLQGN